MAKSGKLTIEQRIKKLDDQKKKLELDQKIRELRGQRKALK